MVRARRRRGTRTAPPQRQQQGKNGMMSQAGRECTGACPFPPRAAPQQGNKAVWAPAVQSDSIHAPKPLAGHAYHHCRLVPLLLSLPLSLAPHRWPQPGQI